MITKMAKKSICGILAAFIIISSVSIRSQAAATYNAYEIISMIFAVVGGLTIEQTQGVIGTANFEPSALYESMNSQSAGVGTLLSSYVNRAQYLTPGSELIISDADYQAFLQYFHDYNLQNSISGELTSTNETEFLQKISQISGLSIQSIPSGVKSKINSGTYKYMLTFTFYPDNTKRIAFGGDFVYNDVQSGVKAVRFSQNYSIYYSNEWAENISASYTVPTRFLEGSVSVYDIKSAIGYKSNTVPNEKIKNGTYDTVSKSRTWDQTQGKLVGNTTITMPATETLDEAINSENVKNLTDAVNVYPVDTADNSMIYYPTQTASDFVVPEIAVNADVSVQFPAIEGEAATYTMDLTNFFPFCIPFDIYAFLQAFEAEPEAPSITYKFPYVNSSGNVVYIEQTYSLSQFDSVAQLVRNLELIAFIVGLAFVTRSFFLRG